MTLYVPLCDDRVTLMPFDESHVEGLRSACAEDRDIWQIYPVSMIDEHFDASLTLLSSMQNWLRYAVLEGPAVVGMTSYINPDLETRRVEIGATYIAPRFRGSGFNRAMKALLIDHAFAHGFEEIEFRIDSRNRRSMRAVEKLGAVQERVLPQNMTTWTGFVRDTVVFSLARQNWELCA